MEKHAVLFIVYTYFYSVWLFDPSKLVKESLSAEHDLSVQ